jgi:uncharacterized heparinase superfamily protein
MALAGKAKLIWHTLPHLRWEQVVYRPLRVLQFRAYKILPQLASRWQKLPAKAPEPAAGITETIHEVFENSFVHLNRPLTEFEDRLTELSAGKFTFLNRTLTIVQPDWNKRYDSHLWNYQFHYFNFAPLCARTLIERGDRKTWLHCRRLMESWMDTARIGLSDGWDAYPVSLRTVNWIYTYALLAARTDELKSDAAFFQKWRAGIYQQLDFLSHHLEKHLLANHLLENAKTLVIGGLFFADDERGKEWLKAGEQLLWHEFAEQVLEDGGHYERAPMYHAQALAGFLECFALLEAFRTRRSLQWSDADKSAIAAKLRKMAEFLERLSYPDNTLALFNDSANTDETSPQLLLESARRILRGENTGVISVFPQTGYFCWISKDGRERMIVDAGEPSVDYNAAHAHCDLLSYELWLDGKPVIVDSGVHGYGGDRFREYARSTRAHNTVMFDGQEQSEIWGTFRLARRAEVLSVEAASEETTWKFSGAYRPYYDQQMIHERFIGRTTTGEWIIEDALQGDKPRRAASFIHLHPDVQAKLTDSGAIIIECRRENLLVTIEAFGIEKAEIIEGAENPIQGWYFPAFGKAVPSKTICLTYHAQPGKLYGYRLRPQAATDN